jgi:hypothetical protein
MRLKLLGREESYSVVMYSPSPVSSVLYFLSSHSSIRDSTKAMLFQRA